MPEDHSAGETRVSIVTPSYNQAGFIRDTARSVARQTYTSIEHLVIDGGSSDGTLEILRGYEDRYDLTWLSEPDAGQGDAVNKGFEQANGQIVGWLNSDDLYVFKDTIETVVRAFEQNPGADIVYGDAIHIDPEGTVIDCKRVRRFSYEALLDGCFLIQPAVFLRRHVVEQHKLELDVEYALDYEYWLRVAQDFTFHKIDQILAADRLHAQRKTMAGADTTKAQSHQIRAKYGYNGRAAYGDVSVTDRLTSGVPRRLLAALDLIRLRQRWDNLAVPLRWDGTIPVLKRQLIPRHRSRYT